MANNTFTGAATGTGDLTNAGNWSLGALNTTDFLIIPQTNFDLFGDLTGTGNFQGVQVTAGWKGRLLGTAAAPVKIKLAANKVWDITGNPNLELVHIGGGAAGTIAKVRASGIPQLTLNTGTITDLEMYNIGAYTVVQDTSVINIRAARCANGLLDVIGTATGPLLIKLKAGSVLTTKRAAQAACDTRIAPGCVLVVADPGSLGSSGTVENDGTLTYKSSVSGPSVEIGPGAELNENKSQTNIAYGTVRDWIESTFDDRPVGITVTPSTRLPVVKAS